MTKFKSFILIVLSINLISCNGQISKIEKNENTSLHEVQSKKKVTTGSPTYSKFENQIGNVVRSVFQDSKMNYWFGGEGGAFRLEGDSLVHIDDIKSEQGRGITIKGITEDKNGKIWFGHTDGISVSDGESIKNYYESDGLLNNDVWCITTDRNNNVWVGTIDGVCVFDGKDFKKFEIPEGKINPNRGVTSKWIVHDIMEDSKGRIWFSTNGGVYIKDGELLTNISEKDGLKTSFVNKVIEDRDGSFWMATPVGLYHYDHEILTNVTDSIKIDGQGVGTVVQDFDGNIWFNSNLRNIFSFDGENFNDYMITAGNENPAPFHMYKDRMHRLWFVGYGGAYRYENDTFVNITKNGPW